MGNSFWKWERAFKNEMLCWNLRRSYQIFIQKIFERNYLKIFGVPNFVSTHPNNEFLKLFQSSQSI